MVLKNIIFCVKLALWLTLFSLVSNRLYAQGQALDMTFYQALQKAERLENSGNFEAAYQQLSALTIKDLSLDQRAQRAFSMAYLGLLSGYKEAPSAMRRFVRDYPNAPEVSRAYTVVGHYYFTKGQYANALAWYEQDKDTQQRTPQQQFEMAFSHFELGNAAKATDLFSSLVAHTQYDSRALYYLAFIDYQNKNWDQALLKLEKIDSEQRDELQAWGLLADLAYRTGDYAQAAAWGLRAMDALEISGVKRDRKSTRLNSSHSQQSRMPSSA